MFVKAGVIQNFLFDVLITSNKNAHPGAIQELSSLCANNSAQIIKQCNMIHLYSDGTKMSKRKKNYPEPTIIVDKFGADAVR